MGAVHLWSLGLHALRSHLDLERALGLGPVPLRALGVRAPRGVLDPRRDLGTGVGGYGGGYYGRGGYNHHRGGWNVCSRDDFRAGVVPRAGYRRLEPESLRASVDN